MLLLLLTSSLFSQTSRTDGPISSTTFAVTKAKAKTKADPNKIVTTGCTDFIFDQDVAWENSTVSGIHYYTNSDGTYSFSGIEDFELVSSATIGTILQTVFSSDKCEPLAYQVSFLADDNGTPGQVLNTQFIPAGQAIPTDEGVTEFWQGTVVIIHIPITPVVLDAGEYWVEITAISETTSFLFYAWATTSIDETHYYRNLNTGELGDYGNSGGLSFALCGTGSYPSLSSTCAPAIEAICQNTTVSLSAVGQASITASDVDGGSTGGTSSTVSPATFGCADVGPNTVTLTVSDDNNNTSTCMATVTIEDNDKPVINTCQGLSAVFNGQVNIAAASVIDVSATDACGINTTTFTPAHINCSQLGQNVSVLVTISDNNGNTETCTATVQTEGLPCGFMDYGDDGIGCQDGNEVDYDTNAESFTLTSSGCSSTNFAQDDAAYVQSPFCGNGEIIVHVAGISPVGQGWAGISMRESEAPGAKKVELLVNLSNMVRRSIRTMTNGYAIPGQFFRPGATWLKLVRNGSMFIGYASSDGVNWQIVLTTNVSMSNCIQAGLMVTNYSASSTVTGTFDHVVVPEIPGMGLQTPSTNGVTQQTIQNHDVDFNIFPNPAKDVLNLDLINVADEEVNIKVYNQLGQAVLQQRSEFTSDRIRVDLNGLSEGTYFIKVLSANGEQVKKFLIVR